MQTQNYRHWMGKIYGERRNCRELTRGVSDPPTKLIPRLAFGFHGNSIVVTSQSRMGETERPDITATPLPPLEALRAVGGLEVDEHSSKAPPTTPADINGASTATLRTTNR